MVDAQEAGKGVLVEINRMMEQIENAKSEKDKLFGRREEKLAQMEREFGFDDLDSADNRLNTLNCTITKRSKRIYKKLEEIKEVYDFDQEND